MSLLEWGHFPCTELGLLCVFDHSWSGGFGQLQTVFIAPIRYPRVRLCGFGLGSAVLLLVLPHISQIERLSAEPAESSVASGDESWQTAMSAPQAACRRINTSHRTRLFDLLGFCGLRVCDHVGHQRALIKQRCYRPGVWPVESLLFTSLEHFCGF